MPTEIYIIDERMEKNKLNMYCIPDKLLKDVLIPKLPNR